MVFTGKSEQKFVQVFYDQMYYGFQFDIVIIIKPVIILSLAVISNVIIMTVTRPVIVIIKIVMQE